MEDLPVLLDRLEPARGRADLVPSADGWELVLAENVAYLVDDQRRAAPSGLDGQRMVEGAGHKYRCFRPMRARSIAP